MPRTPPDFLQSDHISARTRSALLQRMEDEQGKREHLSASSFDCLEQVCDDILPQSSLLGDVHLNLAVMIDKTLAGPGDGWRFADLPTDLKAWEMGLASLNDYAQHLFSSSYTALKAEDRGSLLDDAFAGTLPACSSAAFSPAQMALWSGDMRTAIVSSFLAHPIAQDKLGISANMTGGDKEIQGFSAHSLEQKEAFEPENERRFLNRNHP